MSRVHEWARRYHATPQDAEVRAVVAEVDRERLALRRAYVASGEWQWQNEVDGSIVPVSR